MQLSVTSSPFDGTQLCSIYSTDIFFPEEYEEADVAKAKNICNHCWMKDKCLAFALKTNEKEGVWGGTTPKERRSIRRKAARVRS
jgi:WhiB family redox-sensing transcriptional regulator